MNTIDELTLARIRKERQEALEHAQKAPEHFLAAWVQGVRIVGEGYFECNPTYCTSAPTLRDVSDKWQLTPKWNFIEDNIGVLSGGEAALLAVMCSFYNAEWGGKLMRELGIEGMADISAKLDLKANKIVADLLVNYTGW